VLVDTHCHLADPAYDADRGEVVARARAAGVGHVIVVGESPETADRALRLAAGNPRLSATAGVHPHVASSWTAETGTWLAQRLADPRVVAAGEMGLDYHYDHSPREVQRDVFDRQLDAAAGAGKPAVIHARDADEDVASALRNHAAACGVLHSFSSGLPLLRTALALGWYVSFSGMVTFRSWSLDDAIREAPLNRLLVETDAPFLAPVPHRGRRNEPAWVAAVARRIADVRGLPLDEVIAATGTNAARLFGPRLAPLEDRP
jgi:TatD DNase family protein